MALLTAVPSLSSPHLHNPACGATAAYLGATAPIGFMRPRHQSEAPRRRRPLVDPRGRVAPFSPRHIAARKCRYAAGPVFGEVFGEVLGRQKRNVAVVDICVFVSLLARVISPPRRCAFPYTYKKTHLGTSRRPSRYPSLSQAMTPPFARGRRRRGLLAAERPHRQPWGRSVSAALWG